MFMLVAADTLDEPHCRIVGTILLENEEVPNNEPVYDVANTLPLTVSDADVGVMVFIPILPEPLI